MVDGETNRKALQSQLPLTAPVLLHERHYHGTLVVVVLVIGVRERDAVLRVVPERFWGGMIG